MEMKFGRVDIMSKDTAVGKMMPIIQHVILLAIIINHIYCQTCLPPVLENGVVEAKENLSHSDAFVGIFR